ncbi:MAG: Hpt domain-containing protein [Deltaproteobacteria bacterium]|nr:Hpt domain-containing protein [Deltaproteobacteria bacterium]
MSSDLPLIEPSDSTAFPKVVRVDDEIADLIPGYLQRRRKDCETFHQLLKEGDFSAIRALGHNLKGSGSGYGFQPISIIGRAIEEAALSQNSSSLRVEIAALEDYLDQVRYEWSGGSA